MRPTCPGCGVLLHDAASVRRVFCAGCLIDAAARLRAALTRAQKAMAKNPTATTTAAFNDVVAQIAAASRSSRKEDLFP